MSESDTLQEGLVLPSVEHCVGTLTLNRPDALNAFTLEMARDFMAALHSFESDEGVRVIVLRGKGRVFSAGGDINEMLEDAQQNPGKYPTLQVRVAGFAAYFIDLDKNLQDSIIARTPQCF